jgi:hypothetical protein
MPFLNHHIVAARNKEATARYFTEILRLNPAVRLGEFAVLRVSPHTTLDFIDSEADFDRGCTSMTPTGTAWRYSPGRTAAPAPKPSIRIRSWLQPSTDPMLRETPIELNSEIRWRS